MTKKKILLLVSLIIIVLIGVLAWKFLPIKKTSGAKYEKLEINYIVLPYDGSDLMINESENLQLANTKADLSMTNIKLTVDGKEVDKKTKVKAGKTYNFEFGFEATHGDLSEYVDENTELVINSALGTIPGTLTIKENEGTVKFNYTVKEKKDTPKMYTINCKANGIDFGTYYANENAPFSIFPMAYVPGFLEEKGVVEQSRKNVGIVDVNGDKKRIFDSIIVKSDLKMNYLFTADERKTIDDVEIKTNFDDIFKAGTNVSDLKIINELPKNIEVEFEVYEAEKDPYNDNILVEGKLENKKYRIHGYLDYYDINKTIDPDIKVTIDGKEATNYYITKQPNSTTLAFIIEKEIKKDK